MDKTATERQHWAILVLNHLAYLRLLAQRLTFLASQHHRPLAFLPHCSSFSVFGDTSSFPWLWNSGIPEDSTFGPLLSSLGDLIRCTLSTYWFHPNPFLQPWPHPRTPDSHIHPLTAPSMYLQYPLGRLLDMDTLTATNGALDEPLLTAPSASQSLAIRNSILSDVEAKNCGDSCFTPLFAHFLSNPSANSTDYTFKIYSELFIVLTLPPWSMPPHVSRGLWLWLPFLLLFSTCTLFSTQKPV